MAPTRLLDVLERFLDGDHEGEEDVVCPVDRATHAEAVFLELLPLLLGGNAEVLELKTGGAGKLRIGDRGGLLLPFRGLLEEPGEGQFERVLGGEVEADLGGDDLEGSVEGGCLFGGGSGHRSFGWKFQPAPVLHGRLQIGAGILLRSQGRG